MSDNLASVSGRGSYVRQHNFNSGRGALSDNIASFQG